MRRFLSRIFFLFLLLVSPFGGITFAQTSGVPGLVNNTIINDSEAKAGDIVSNTSDGIRRTSKGYDAQMIGVVVSSPVISVGDRTDTTVPILSSGRALVNVSAISGAILPGDFVTSSETAGVGQKASAAGYVLGKALEGWDDSANNGQIAILVEIGYFSQNPNVSGLLASILTALNIGFQNAQNFPLIMRYLAAALVGVATFGFAAFSFLRFMRNGIEAIGRNPLAKNTIISGMVINGVVVGLLAASGFGIAAAIVLL